MRLGRRGSVMFSVDSLWEGDVGAILQALLAVKSETSTFYFRQYLRAEMEELTLILQTNSTSEYKRRETQEIT